jgi:heme/copper-type cytochrome/quinol oxidase subunit 4
VSLLRRSKQAERKERREPSRYTEKAIKYLDRLRKILPHPVWGIVVATLIAFSGRSELILRSIGMCLIAIWLSLDLWAWLLRKRPRWAWTMVFGCTCTSLMLIAVMGIMWLWLDGKLADERDEAFRQLSSSASLSDGTDPIYTLFKVTNASGSAISGKHQLVCFINLAVGDDGTSSMRDVYLAYLIAPETGHWSAVFGGGKENLRRYRDRIPEEHERLSAYREIRYNRLH